MFAGLMSRWDQSRGVGFGEGPAGLIDEVDHAGRRLRAVLLHQSVEIEAVEELHHVVEGPVVGPAEVVELDRVRGSEARGDLSLGFEPGERGVAVGAEGVAADQLDRGVTGEQPVLRYPDLAHAATAEAPHQTVVPALVRFLHRRRDQPPGDHREPRDHRSGRDDEHAFDHVDAGVGEIELHDRIWGVDLAELGEGEGQAGEVPGAGDDPGEEREPGIEHEPRDRGDQDVDQHWRAVEVRRRAAGQQDVGQPEQHRGHRGDRCEHRVPHPTHH